MFFRYIRIGFLCGLAYGVLFLLLEDMASLALTRTDFTSGQLFSSLIVYASMLIIAGLFFGLLQFIFTKERERNIKLISGRIFLLFTFLVLFYLGYGIIPSSILPESDKAEALVFLAWGTFLLLIYWAVVKILQRGKGADLSVVNLRCVGAAWMITVFLIIHIKIKFDPYISDQYRAAGIGWFWMALLFSMGILGLVMWCGKKCRRSLPGSFKSRKDWRWLAIGLVFLAAGVGLWRMAVYKMTDVSIDREYERNTDSPPNIIFIVVDALRADHLSLYGYERDTTPNIDAHSSGGVVFKNAWAASSWTKPSAASYLTGLFPGMHGIGDFFDMLSDELETMPEILGVSGYYSKAISTNNNVSADYNYDQGFNDFKFIRGHDYKQLLFPHPLLAGRFPILLENAYRWGLVDGNILYGDASTLNRSVIPWLKLNHDKQFFLYLHYMEPHYPYYPIRPNYSKGLRLTLNDLRTIRDTRRASLKDLEKRSLLAADERRKSLVETVINRYDDEIAEADRRVEELFEVFDELKLWENSLIIFTSDHGEEFFDHGMGDHGNTMYNEVIHIPLVIFFPQGEYAGAIISEQVHLIDLMPTIFDYTGIFCEFNMNGASLMPLLAGDEARFINNRGHYFGEVEVFREELPWERVYAMSKDNFKLIKTLYKDAEYGIELYDIEADPCEKSNLADLHPELTEELLSELEAYIAFCDSLGIQSTEFDEAGLSEENRKRLRALGYIK